MTREGITINELSKLANVTVRTIRFYTDEGVLDEPSGRDRYARYTRRHYLQLNAARALKERYYPLRVIRDRMASMTESELELEGGPIPAHIEARFAEAYAAESMVARLEMRVESLIDSAPAQQIVESMAYHDFPTPISSIKASADFSAPVDGALPNGRLASRPARSVGDVWHRILVAPGIELHVRDDAMQDSAGEVRRIMASMRKR